MRQNDRLLRIWTYVTGFGLSLLGMSAGVLGWSPIVQFALAALVIAVPLATLRVAAHGRRRR